MSRWLRWLLDRLIITAIAAVVIGGGTWVALNTSWFKAPRRGTPVGEMTPEEIRLAHAVYTRNLTVGVQPPEGWRVVTASGEAETREAIAIEEIVIRTAGGRVVVREAAKTFADGDRTLISFPVITQAQRIRVSGRIELEEPEDLTVQFHIRYFKLGRDATVLRRTNGRWNPTTTLAENGREREATTGLYAHALPAAEFKKRLTELPFESVFDVAVRGTPPPSLLAARKKAGVVDGPRVLLRGENAWLLESGDGRTWLVDGKRSEPLPGRLVALVTALREKELARRHPPFAARVRVGGREVTAETLLTTVRQLAAEGREFDGLRIRDR